MFYCASFKKAKKRKDFCDAEVRLLLPMGQAQIWPRDPGEGRNPIDILAGSFSRPLRVTIHT